MDTVSLAVLLAAVFFANIYASSVGGASLLILPVMFLVGMPANIAVGTNRLHRVFATGISTAKYLKNVKVEMKNLVLFSAISILGAILGALVVVSLDESILKLMISVVLLLLALFFLVKKDLGLKEIKEKRINQNMLFSPSALFGIAVYRAIIGSAAGTFLRMYFVLRDGFNFLQAATYSSVLALVTSISATIVFVLAGIVDYRIALYMIIVGMLGSYLGAHIAITKGNRFIRKLFLLVIIITSLRLLGGVLLGI